MSRTSCLEEDLYDPVKAFLESQGYDVRSEVHHCDVTAIKEGQLVIVELKKNLSVDLLVQGVLRQKMGDLVYLAVPKPKALVGTKKWRDICHLLRRLELGLLLVTPAASDGRPGFVELALDPEPFDREKSRRASTKKKDRLMLEHQGRRKDLNKGGSKGKKLVTAYRELVIQIACCLEVCGPLNPKMIRERGIESPKIGSILKADHYGWFRKLGSGLFELREEGRQELELYSELTHHYRAAVQSRGCRAEIFTLEQTLEPISVKIMDVQKKAYGVEAELIGFSDIPQLGESIEKLRASEETFIGCFASEERLSAFLSYKVSDGALTIHRLCVHPDCFKRGLGSGLLDHVIGLCENTHRKGPKKKQIHRVMVTAAGVNEPAIQLYHLKGFREESRFVVAEGLEMIQFSREIPYTPEV